MRLCLQGLGRVFNLDSEIVKDTTVLRYVKSFNLEVIRVNSVGMIARVEVL